MKRNWFIAWHIDYHDIAPIEGITSEDYFHAEELNLSDFGYVIDVNYSHNTEYPGLYWQGLKSDRPTDSTIQKYLKDNEQSLFNYGYKKENY